MRRTIWTEKVKGNQDFVMAIPNVQFKIFNDQFSLLDSLRSLKSLNLFS